MDKVEKAKADFEKAKARLQKVQALARQKERKRDARRKIILGGMIIAEASRTANGLDELKAKIARLPEKDRKAFEGWTLLDDRKEEKESDPWGA